MSYLDYCEPDYLLSPDNSQASSDEQETTRSKKLPIYQGNLRTCGIIASYFGLKKNRNNEATLSNYWAQEMIGSDLLKEELKKVPPPSKNRLVAVFDTPSEHKEVGHDVKGKKSDFR